MLHTVLLSVHVTAGISGLLLGPLALIAAQQPNWHPRRGVAYQGAVAVMTTTALGLVALAPGRLWGLGLVAAATEAAALAGWRVRRRPFPGLPAQHIRLMYGSYLSFVTAALVVSWPSPLAWVLPTVIGAPLISRAVNRTRHAGKTPSITARPVRTGTTP